ncbi:MAG: VanW family protein [Myxococcota bacterium]
MRRSPASSGPWSTLERVDFAVRVAGLSAKRLAQWALQRERFPHPTRIGADATPHAVAEVHVPRRASSFGPRLEAGRWHNLALAAAALDGVGITVERPFSFWRTVGRLDAARGFVEGAHFEGGCIVPAVGGGICALSDALFDLALRADCEILERHAHTLAVDRGPDAPLRRRVDATVKWPYVDLRFAPRQGVLRLSARVDAAGLRLSIASDRKTDAADVHVSEPQRACGADGPTLHATITRRRPAHAGRRLEVIGRDRKRLIAHPTRNCDTCQEHGCGRYRGS